MSNGRYKLDGHNPVPCEDLVEWAMDLGNDDIRRVAYTELPDGVQISTVFLGLDHNFSGEGDPVLFETMVFGGEHNHEMVRYTTWEEAEKGHAEMVKKVSGA